MTRIFPLKGNDRVVIVDGSLPEGYLDIVLPDKFNGDRIKEDISNILRNCGFEDSCFSLGRSRRYNGERVTIYCPYLKFINPTQEVNSYLISMFEKFLFPKKELYK